MNPVPGLTLCPLENHLYKFSSFHPAGNG